MHTRIEICIQESKSTATCIRITCIKLGSSAIFNDGDHQDQAFNKQPASLHIHSSPKEVNNIHALVKNTLEHSDRIWADSIENWPDLVHLLGLEDEGMIDCFAPSL